MTKVASSEDKTLLSQRGSLIDACLVHLSQVITMEAVVEY